MNDLAGDRVWLTIGPEYNEGELISRMKLPDDATRAALEIDGSYIEGGEDQMYEVWTVER